MTRKLTHEDVALIRELVEHRKELARQYSALTDRALAEKFGVHYRTIGKVIAGETWNDLSQFR